jgi:hypothetical protein
MSTSRFRRCDGGRGKESRCRAGRRRRRGEERMRTSRLHVFLRRMPACLQIAKKWKSDMGYSWRSDFFSFFLKKTWILKGHEVLLEMSI